MDIHEDVVIPDNHGKVFTTNAKDLADLERLKLAIFKLSSVKKVSFDTNVFPVEFTVFTEVFMKVTDIQDKVREVGFHALPKSSFPLEI